MKVERHISSARAREPGTVRNPGLLLAVLSAALAVSVLIFGWGFGMELFIRVRPGFPAMVPETALAIFAGSIAAAALHGGLPRCAGPIGVAFVIASILLFFVRPVASSGLMSGDAMSLATALGLSGFALSAGLRHLSRLEHSLLPQTISTLAAAFSLLAIFGYFFDASALNNVHGFTEIALHTAIGLFGINTSLLLLDTGRGWVAILAGPGRGSRFARRMVPALSAITLIFCEVMLYATDVGLLEPNFRIALLATAMIAAVLGMGLALAWQINQAENRAAGREAARHASDDIRHARELSDTRAMSGDLLSRVAAGVAHEFNNALAAMRGNLELIEHDPENSALYVREAVAATERAATLTSELLASGYRARLVPGQCDVEALVSEHVTAFRRQTGAQVSLWVNLPGAPEALANVDKAQFSRALGNLLNNARDAQPGGGHIEVRVCVETITNPLASKFNGSDGIAPGEYVIIDVLDNGPGMIREIVESATKPFFTTKPVGKGTGLGLSSAYGFCRQSGGGLQIESAPGKGTLVRMALPLCARKAAPEIQPGAAGDTNGRFDVLLVGRDPVMNQQMETRLSRDGHKVCAVLSCDAALQMLERHALPSACIIDIGQPARRDRQMLAQLIERRYPACAVTRISPSKPDDEPEDEVEQSLARPRGALRFVGLTGFRT